MNKINALLQEAIDFVLIGSKYGFANPQSMSKGTYEGKYANVNGVQTIDLTRLDYLSLGQSQEIREIMQRCIRDNNISCPTSRMALRSESDERLEGALADLHGMQDSITFLSGYCVNENIIQALALRMKSPHLFPYVHGTGMGHSVKDVPTEFFVDEETHYSITHTIKLARLRVKESCICHRYPSADYGRLVAQLDQSKKTRRDSIRIIVSDTISSISGRVFDVHALCELAEIYDCYVYLDEAHAIGTFGNGGCGIASDMPDFFRFRNRLMIMGTLTKAIAQLGGYVAITDKSLSCFLRACSPQYIFSAPIPPWMAESLVQIIDLVKGEYGDTERKKLHKVAAYMRESFQKAGFNILSSKSQIISVLIGEEDKAIRTKMALEAGGFTTALFMNPAVPKGKAVIRFSLCSDITCEEIDQIVRLLKKARDKIGFIKSDRAA